jgi:hypothetical protein
MAEPASYSSPPTAARSARGPVSPARIGWLQRTVMVLAGSVLVGLLITAACLTPSRYGMGTHKQLGLPDCTIVQLFGTRCPSCGMTTSWSHMMRGRVISSFQANAGGALLALASLACGPWLLVSGWRGRWTLAYPHEGAVLLVGITIIAVTLTDWTLRVWI